MNAFDAALACGEQSCLEDLALFRSAYAMLLAGALLARLRSHVELARRSTSERGRPRVLGVLPVPPLGFRAVGILGGLLTVLLALAAVNVWSPVTLLLASAASCLYFPQVIAAPDVGRKAGTVPVILVLLGLVGTTSGPDRQPVAALVLLTVKLLVAQAYFSAGLCKLRTSGWRWTDGRTLRSWLAYYALQRPSPLAPAAWRLPSLAVCRVSSTLTLFFELTFWIGAVVPAAAGYFVAAAIIFHAATAILMRIHYWLFFGPGLVVFLVPLFARWLA